MATVEIDTGKYVKRYDFWNPATWTIPKLYWDAFSQEQRIHAICRQLAKVIAYADYVGVNVDDIAQRLQDIEDGKLDDYIVAAIETWFEENEPAMLAAIESISNAMPLNAFDSDNTVKDAIDLLNYALPLTDFDSDNTVKDAIDSLDADITSIQNKINANMFVSVKDYGAVGDGVTDDTEAIQAAIDSGYDVYFPATRNEQYIVTDTLVTNREGQSFFSDPSYPNSGILFRTESETLPLFRCEHELIRFDNMHIRAVNAHTGIGILAHCTTAYVDNVFTNNTDVTVMESDIINFYIGVQANARGPRIVDNSFSLCRTALEIFWDDQDDNIGTDAGKILYGNDYGMRGIQILNNRFHVISSRCISITNGSPFGMIVSGNRFDVGRGYFIYAVDRIKNTTIEGNIICYPDVQAINLLGGVEDSTISDNVFVGFYTPGSMGQRTTTGIFINLHDASNVSIVGNTFKNCIEDAIRIELGVCVSIIGNTIDNVGFGTSSSDIRGLVFLNTSGDRITCIGNSGTFNKAINTILHTRSVTTLTRSTVLGNAIIGSATGNYTDNGQNNLQTALTA